MEIDRGHPPLIAGFCAKRPPGQDLRLCEAGNQWIGIGFDTGLHDHAGRAGFPTGWEVHIQLSGRLVLEHRDRRHELGPGDAYVVHPRTLHRLHHRSGGPAHFQYAVFDVEALIPPDQPQLSRLWRELDCVRFHASADSRTTLELLASECESDRPLRREAIDWALRLFVLSIMRSIMGADVSQPMGIDALWARVDRLLGDDLRRPWTMDDLAESVGLTPNYLAQRYKAVAGCTPMESLRKMRIERAKRLLGEPGLRVIDVAREVGFSSSQHFATVFGRITGTTPLAYRRSVTVADRRGEPSPDDPEVEE